MFRVIASLIGLAVMIAVAPSVAAQNTGSLESCGGERVLEASCGKALSYKSGSQSGNGGKPQPGVRPPTGSGADRGVGTNTATGFPSGTWQQTCRNPRWEGRTLVTTCQTSYGAWVYSSFDTNLAFTTLSNCDGVLRPVARCEDHVIAAPAPAARTPLPAGSWASACRQGSVENGVLSAVCRQPGRWVQRPSDNRYIWEEGGLVSVRLPLNGYTGPVSFCDGQLQRRPEC